MSLVEVGVFTGTPELEMNETAMNLVTTFALTGLFICVLCGAAFGAVVTLLFGPSSDVLLISTGCAAGLFTALILGKLCLTLLNETVTMMRATTLAPTASDPSHNNQKTVVLNLTDTRVN